ncbi:MAG: pyridoxamine 5'-phosphate oxidase [Actinomycetota bacterium]|nr:pyridoxamine 5'-phosphate oxidase [Actinomycetota bacterium]
MASLRAEYRRQGLAESAVDPDPLVTFRAWLDAAVAAGLNEPNAMVLSTVDARSRPHARAVLLKGLDRRGFRFFTNHRSDKARQLAANPSCALTFVWPALARQVRVTGTADRIADAEAAAYFATRPRGSRLGAWASAQSEVIAGRDVLDRRLAELEALYADTDDIPLPPFWGGYVVVPDTVELWQGRPNRLHDRLRYSRPQPGASWHRQRLAP